MNTACNYCFKVQIRHFFVPKYYSLKEIVSQFFSINCQPDV